MKSSLKNVAAFALVLSLALSISSIHSEAKAVKGVVAPLTVIETDDGGLRGSSSVSSWNIPGVFSSDFTSYKLSADVYIPYSAFKNYDGSVFIDPQVQFWFEDLGINAYLDNATGIRVGYDFENDCPFYVGFNKADDTEIGDLSYVTDIKKINDMIKLEIVDAPVTPTMLSPEWDDATGKQKVWTDPIPTKGDACPQIKIGTDRPLKTKFAVTNASIKIGDKEYKTDYSTSDGIAGFYGEIEDYSEMKASTFNTIAVTVAKTSVSVKKKKSATVKVTTMFSGDKVTCKSSAAKVAKATYKSGKLTIKGVKKGKATITVKANGATKTIKVTVK